MAAITHARPRAGFDLSRGFGAAWRAWRAWRADAERRAAYRQTRRELSSLSDRELDDLGLSRWDIDRVARECVWGR